MRVVAYELGLPGCHPGGEEGEKPDTRSNLFTLKGYRTQYSRKQNQLKSAFKVGGLAPRVHPFSFRTRKLSLVAPMVLSF